MLLSVTRIVVLIPCVKTYDAQLTQVTMLVQCCRMRLETPAETFMILERWSEIRCSPTRLFCRHIAVGMAQGKLRDQ